MARRALTACLSLVALVLLLAPAPALAFNPDDVVGGAGSKWFSGDLLQQTGTNCSVLGNPYTEVMVSGIASYGGTQGVPAVGDGYYTSFLISVPGNPCGPGSSAIATDVVLPPFTTIDTTRQIRCFGELRNQTTFTEDLTNQTWSFLGSSGRYCPTQATPSALHSGAWSLGFRPIASGQLFQIFVPVKTTQQLVGAGVSPAHGFRWLTDATGVYANPGLSTVWANVLPSGGGGSGPFVYFAREPAIGFWNAGAPVMPSDLRNRVELFVNLYTAGLAGTLCYEVRRVSDNSPRATCAIDPGYNPNVPAGLSLAQIQPGSPLVTGPNGGYAPFAFDPPSMADPIGEWGVDMKIIWTFTPSSGPPVTKEATFRTLPGPDDDGDGVPNASDTCPAVKGTLANGCNPAVVPDPDGDGVYGAADLCPALDGKGALNGCPGGVVPTPPAGTTPGTTTPPATGRPTTAPVARLAGRLTLRRNAKLLRSALLKGAKVRFTCTRDSTAAATLTVTKKVATSIGIPAKARILSLASAKGRCKAKGGGTLTLRIAAKYRRKVRASKRLFAATVGLRLSVAGAKAASSTISVKVG